MPTAAARSLEYAYSPSSPKSFTMWIGSLPLPFTPTTPIALSSAEIVPATCVPWWLPSKKGSPVPGSADAVTGCFSRSSWPRE
ncbi:MAG: hypothetical protein IPK07_12380 [Deltaproteobacteria bacterium]|nr:hypothetical protein [Deltaproteobacteria bacterium]